jgi:Mg/Co/Ni transporter MgtE
MDLTSLLIQLVSGIAGGNVGGAANKARNLGPLWNTILGAIGGLGVGQLLGGTVAGAVGSQTTGNIGASAIVGLLLPLIVSFFKKKPAAA